MTRRITLAFLAASLALLAALQFLTFSLYRSERRAVAASLAERLSALGRTTARWLDRIEQPVSAREFLAALAVENRLEDAYVVDGQWRVLAGARTQAGSRVNLLRAEPGLLEAALGGAEVTGPGYSLEGARVDAGCFPVRRSTQPWVLVLEAGEEYQRPLGRVRVTYLTASALSALLAIVFATGMGLALRALERARVAFGRQERLAAVGEMAAMVAHEVRNPLGILRAQVELQIERAGPTLADRERARLGDMLIEIDRLSALTAEFLALARDAPMDLRPCPIAAVVHETAEAVRALPDASGAQVEVVVPDSAVVAPADPSKLRQALYNLLANAVQNGGDGVHVRVEVARTLDEVRIRVVDDGPGVPEELRPRLFEPFVTARTGGTGLGLAISRRIAERHGGRLTLEPNRPGGRGAAFSLVLPLAAEEPWRAS